ncbi:hypothetical protein [Sulfitobacter geojensis]|uniref:Replication protein n=1 Tax=Sulfitobacter geojensis TaxID=1342299 RepID=A0AAE2W180_9RHOB|nr:hypothetical protein [Sulfitobacter geojensis]MBM1690684.1 hypothetical protein [Sulfitobacter geojensis]MBM1694750.1 hypothetical protein [Sulfitobacter geojensis]MBM1707544.1 hypothetical protein [Sulfitobacter geojensis]MBM1711154.1 hypothetical protein [Sulfitobacter geojensis]MBM1715669.1 hypothetical protein [Sulfitobacter geojensis]
MIALDSNASLLKQGEKLREYLNDPEHQYRLFVTMNSNASTTQAAMQNGLAKWYGDLNNKTYRRLKAEPQSSLWQGWGFLEGHEAEAAEQVTLHWHVLIGPGPTVKPLKYADLMTSLNPGEEPLIQKHMQRAWQKVYPKGTIIVSYIDDLAGAVNYCTKDLCRPGLHLRRSHQAHSPLPFRKKEVHDT